MSPVGKRTVLCLVCSLGLAGPAGAEIVLEAEHLAVRIDDVGAVRGLVGRRNGINYQPPDQSAPLLRIRVAGQIYIPKAIRYEKSKGDLTLQYSEGIVAVVKTATKATHITFEIVSVEPEEGVELVIWGPYPTRIKEIVGETVGVVWNDSFALGIQTLNVKTLGGYPTTGNDVMPGRGDTAKPMEFGSVLQAFTRDRRQSRVVSNWGHSPHGDISSLTLASLLTAGSV